MKTSIMYIVLAMLLITASAKAQDQGTATTSVAILGGVNFQNLNGMDANGDKLENQLLAGFHVGINMLVPVAPEFFFQPGLLFSTKGAKNVGDNINTTYRVSYVELPLNFVYKSQVGNGHILLGFGPYVGYAISGKASYENKSNSVEVKDDIEFTNEVAADDTSLTPYLRPLDVGGNLFFGYELVNGIFFQLNTQLGLVNIHPDDQRIANDDTMIKNTGFGLSLGYRF